MRVAHRHLNVLMACQGSDFRQRDSSLDQSTDEGVAQGVEADLAYARLDRRTLQCAIHLCAGIWMTCRRDEEMFGASALEIPTDDIGRSHRQRNR